MSTLSLVSLIVNIILGISVVSLVFKDKIYTSYTKRRDNRRDTERLRIRQVVEEVLKEIIKEDE